MLFTAFREFFAPFPEFERRIEVEASLLELLNHRDQLFPRFFVSKFTNKLHFVVPSGPSLMAVIAPSATRTRNCVPFGASAVVRSTAPWGIVCTTA